MIELVHVKAFPLEGLPFDLGITKFTWTGETNPRPGEIHLLEACLLFSKEQAAQILKTYSDLSFMFIMDRRHYGIDREDLAAATHQGGTLRLQYRHAREESGYMDFLRHLEERAS